MDLMCILVIKDELELVLEGVNLIVFLMLYLC